MPDDSSLVAKRAELRRKILGVKIRHARNRSGLNHKEVGQALGISPDVVSEIELGLRDITLPQLEVMALIFNVPIIYFWSDDIVEDAKLNFPTKEALNIRQRMIGTLLQQARTSAGRSQEELAQVLGVPVDTITHYEFGQLEIPLHQLETLAGYLNVPIDFFMDQSIASQDEDTRGASLDEIAQFSQLPADVREFISNPANLLYIYIAMKISNVPAETLRGLAEGLLEVTY